MRSRPTHSSRPLRGMLALAMLGCLAGCSKTSPMQPGPAAESRLEVASPHHVLRVWTPPSPVAPAGVTVISPVDSVPSVAPSPPDWRRVGGGRVSPGQGTTIQVGRYGLVVEAGTVESSTEFTVSEYDTTVLDIELGPHGIVFGKPVALCVSYAGTNADPDCPAYDASEPQVVWYNDDGGVWTPVPGVIDAAAKTIIVKLAHFSRYAVQKASW